MIQIEFTKQEVDDLEEQRFSHPHPKAQRRLEALYLKSQGLAHHLICQLCRITEPTLVRYVRAYAQDRHQGLKQLGYRGRPSGLAPRAEALEACFRQQPPQICAHAQQIIEQQVGVRRGLTQVAQFYGPALPISVFLDNARYQRCALVQAHARALGIELDFLPSYSPNLNLIERYWKWVKKQCLNAKYHQSFTTMKEAILGCIRSGHLEHQTELNSLLSWKSQSFRNLIN